MTRQVFKSILLSLIFYALLYVPIAGAEELVAFDPELNEFPESVSADVSGNVYVSLQGSNGEIWRIKPNGKMALHFRLDPLPPEDSLGVLGVLTDGPSQLFAAVASFDPATSGIWQIKINGTAHRVEGSEIMIAPNDLAIDDDGNIYVTDVILGAVWRMSPEGHGGYTVQLWVIDPLLAGNGISVLCMCIATCVCVCASLVEHILYHVAFVIHAIDKCRKCASHTCLDLFKNILCLTIYTIKFSLPLG